MVLFLLLFIHPPLSPYLPHSYIHLSFSLPPSLTVIFISLPLSLSPSRLQNSRKLKFIEHPSNLYDYIDQDHSGKMPGTTLALEEDLKVYNNALKLSHKDTKVALKVSRGCLRGSFMAATLDVKYWVWAIIILWLTLSNLLYFTVFICPEVTFLYMPHS